MGTNITSHPSLTLKLESCILHGNVVNKGKKESA